MRFDETRGVGDRHALRDRDPREGFRVHGRDLFKNALRFRVDRKRRRAGCCRCCDDREKMHREGLDVYDALRLVYLTPSGPAARFF